MASRNWVVRSRRECRCAAESDPRHACDCTRPDQPLELNTQVSRESCVVDEDADLDVSLLRGFGEVRGRHERARPPTTTGTVLLTAAYRPLATRLEARGRTWVPVPTMQISTS